MALVLLTLASVLGIAATAAHGLPPWLSHPHPFRNRRPRAVRVGPSLSARVALLLASLGLTLGMLELGARLVVDTPWGKPVDEQAGIVTVAWSPNAFDPDPVLGYRMAPNFEGRIVRRGEYDVHFRTNSISLRDRELGPPVPGTSRILVVGDSFVFGDGVEQSEPFAKVLERRLGDHRPGAFEVVNGGVGGYGIDQYEAWTGRLLAQTQPDLLLVSLFVGNDFREAYPSPGTAARPSQTAVDGHRTLARSPLGTWLSRHSHLGYLAMRTQPRLARRLANFRGVTEGPSAATAVASAEPYLQRIRSRAARAGVPVGFIVMPSKRQLQAGPLAVPFEERAQRVQHLLADAGVPTLDLAPSLRPGVDELYFEHDGHLNAYGHEAVAAAVEPWVMHTFTPASHASLRQAAGSGPS